MMTSLKRQKWTDEESWTKNWDVGWILAIPLDMTSEYLMSGCLVVEDEQVDWFPSFIILKLDWFGWIKTLTHILHSEWRDSLWTELKWLLNTFMRTVKILNRELAMIESYSWYGPKDEIIISAGPAGSVIFCTALSVNADCNCTECVDGSWYTDGLVSCGNRIFLSIAFPSSSTTGWGTINYSHENKWL